MIPQVLDMPFLLPCNSVQPSDLFVFIIDLRVQVVKDLLLHLRVGAPDSGSLAHGLDGKLISKDCLSELLRFVLEEATEGCPLLP